MDDHQLYGDSRLPPELDERVRAELRDGERLLWVGQPDPGLMARGTIFLVLFGIPWTLFAIFWIAMASGFAVAGVGFAGEAGIIGVCFPLFGVPFVVIGFFLLSSPYWVRKKAAKTCYALTDRRALIWQSGWFGSIDVRSYGPRDLSRLHRTEHSDGRGDLVFEEIVGYRTDSDGYSRRHTTRIGFLAIDRVREIEELVERALLKDREP